MALDRSALLEVLEALKTADVEDRIRSAAILRARKGQALGPAANPLRRGRRVASIVGWRATT
jgi:hypothetical protein